jgi:putative hydrolase of the HAD superfamily
MSVKLLTFDLDDTLWPCMETMLKTEDTLHQWFNEYHPEISSRYSMDELRHKRIALARKHKNLAHDFTAIRKKSFAELSRELQYSYAREEQFIQDAFDLYFIERNRVNLYQDVIPTLEILKQTYRLAAVSNGNADIYLIGLGHLFEFSWSAADAGQQKPHPIVFESMLEKYQLHSDEVIHIGDDPINDIQGAYNAGIRSVWLNRNHSTWPAEITRAFIEIDQLNQLPAAIMTL